VLLWLSVTSGLSAYKKRYKATNTTTIVRITVPSQGSQMTHNKQTDVIPSTLLQSNTNCSSLSTPSQNEIKFNKFLEKTQGSKILQSINVWNSLLEKDNLPHRIRVEEFPPHYYVVKVANLNLSDTNWVFVKVGFTMQSDPAKRYKKVVNSITKQMKPDIPNPNVEEVLVLTHPGTDPRKHTDYEKWLRGVIGFALIKDVPKVSICSSTFSSNQNRYLGYQSLLNGR
jgi:hypothetical protein